MAFRKFAQALLQFGERNVERSRKVTKRELVFGTDIEHRHQIVAQSRDQVVARDRVERVAGVKIVGHDTADLGDIPFADSVEGFDQRDHFGVAGEAIENVFAAALGLDEAANRPDQTRRKILRR